MSLPLTPQLLAAAYEYMRAAPPFNRMKLPHADEVEFSVTRHRDREADHTTYHRTLEHVIRVSAYFVKDTRTLLEAMGHEMNHAHQARTKTESRRREHNAEFNRINARMCKTHGWEIDVFN